jgi:hypothetical protein
MSVYLHKYLKYKQKYLNARQFPPQTPIKKARHEFDTPPRGMNNDNYGTPPRGMNNDNYGTPQRGMNNDNYGTPPRGMNNYGTPPRGMNNYGTPPRGMNNYGTPPRQNVESKEGDQAVGYMCNNGLWCKKFFNEKSYKTEVTALEKLKNVPGVIQIIEKDENAWVLKFKPLQEITVQEWESNGELIKTKVEEILNLVHNKKIAHNDIKKNNIMKKSNGEYILIDFGLAKEMNTISEAYQSDLADFNELLLPIAKEDGFIVTNILGFTTPDSP